MHSHIRILLAVKNFKQVSTSRLILPEENQAKLLKLSHFSIVVDVSILDFPFKI